MEIRCFNIQKIEKKYHYISRSMNNHYNRTFFQRWIQMTLSKLSGNVLYEITSYATLKEVYSLLQLSKQWNALMKQDAVWIPLENQILLYRSFIVIDKGLYASRYCWAKDVVIKNRLKDGDQPGGILHAVYLWRTNKDKALKLYGPIENWNTCYITDMSKLFQYYRTFNGDLSRWNTGNVKDMEYMFSEAKAFNGDLSRWDTGNVENMSGMFDEATAFNGDLSQWDTCNVKRMQGMFDGATTFNGDLSPWNTGNVRYMQYMFYGATAFNRDLSQWNTGNVIKMTNMFRLAKAFNRDLSRWNTCNVEYMEGMFYKATAFNHQYRPPQPDGVSID